MGFSEAVRTCLKLKYATFEGRAARSEYWYFMLFVLLVAVVLGGLAGLMMGTSGFENMQNGGSMPVASMILFGLLGIFYLAILLPSIGVAVRRFHDRNLSGWYYPVSYTHLDVYKRQCQRNLDFILAKILPPEAPPQPPT